MTLRDKLLTGMVIPAHPLALNQDRKLDERRQRVVGDRRDVDRVGGHAGGDGIRRNDNRVRGKRWQPLVRPLTSATATRWRLRLRQGVIGALAPAHTRTVATTKRRDQCVKRNRHFRYSLWVCPLYSLKLSGAAEQMPQPD